MTADLEELAHWLHDNKLIVPPLPKTLTSSVRRSNRHTFSSRTEVVSPYDFEQHVNEALDPQLADYVLVAHAGHGANSYAISYYVAWSGFRILFQLAWGGLYMDNEVAGQHICDVFNRFHDLWPTLCARDSKARPVLVASSDFYGGLLARDGVQVDRWSSDSGGCSSAFAHLRRELGLDGELGCLTVPGSLARPAKHR
jgi:hypothetical protein